MSMPDFKPPRTVIETPTVNLKFVDGKLHQEWEIAKYGYGMLGDMYTEWREVPGQTETICRESEVD